MSLSVYVLAQILSCTGVSHRFTCFSPSDSATIKFRFITSLLHLFLQKVRPLREHICVICNAHLVACQHQLASPSLLRDLNNSYCLLSRDAGPGGAARSIWPEFPEREPDVAHHLSSQRAKGTISCESSVDYMRTLDTSLRVSATPCRIRVYFILQKSLINKVYHLV